MYRGEIMKHIFNFNRAFFADLYLDYLNNFISLESFAAWHNANNASVLCELPTSFYESCINRGRLIVNGAMYQYHVPANNTTGYNRSESILLREYSA